ncbi:hypothetical protein H0N99_04740 [Candidatus Micrarchaeota archaeon]|nr:hypothetical protein [Candidatus Micrarchaeota archaeon]
MSKKYVKLAEKPQGEAEAHKIIVGISSQNPSFARQLSERLRQDKHLSIMSNPSARDVYDRMRNIILATDQAFRTNADCVISVNCDNPKNWTDFKPLELNPKHKLYVNVLSNQLLVATALCKDKAYVNKFPGEVEKEIVEITEQLAHNGNKQVPFALLGHEMLKEKKSIKLIHHEHRAAMKRISEGKVFLEINVPLRGDERADRAAEDCAIVIDRICKFNSAKNDAVLKDSRLLLR